MSVSLGAGTLPKQPTAFEVIFSQLKTMQTAQATLLTELRVGTEVVFVAPDTNPIVIAVTDTAERLHAVDGELLVRSVILHGVKSFDANGKGISNGNNVRFGIANDKMPVVITPGGFAVYTAPGFSFFDLNDVWIIGDAGDGVHIDGMR